MAKAKRKSGEAKDFNEDFEQARQETRDTSGNVVSLTPKVDEAKTLATVREITAEFNRLKAEGKAINEQRKACLEKIDAAGLDRHEFKALVKLLEVDEVKRALKARTRALFLKAHNLPEQLDLLDDDKEDQAEGLTPGLQREFLGATDDSPTGSAALDAALQNGFLTEEEIERNRAIEMDLADNRDAPDEDEDTGDFTAAEVDEQTEMDA